MKISYDFVIHKITEKEIHFFWRGTIEEYRKILAVVLKTRWPIEVSMGNGNNNNNNIFLLDEANTLLIKNR